MIRYKTYMREIPKKFKKVNVSFCNKPNGGLWGCRGDEWKEWCEAEEFALENLKTCFIWRLKRGSKVYKIKTKKDFDYLVNNYVMYIDGMPMSIDFVKLSKEYDAVEAVGDIVYKLRYGTCRDINDKLFLIKSMGLYSWDVPSICVMNPDKVVYERKM